MADIDSTGEGSARGRAPNAPNLKAIAKSHVVHRKVGPQGEATASDGPVDSVVDHLRSMGGAAKQECLIAVAGILGAYEARIGTIRNVPATTGDPVIDDIVELMRQMDDDARSDCKFAVDGIAKTHDAHLAEVRRRRAGIKLISAVAGESK